MSDRKVLETRAILEPIRPELGHELKVGSGMAAPRNVPERCANCGASLLSHGMHRFFVLVGAELGLVFLLLGPLVSEHLWLGIASFVLGAGVIAFAFISARERERLLCPSCGQAFLAASEPGA